MKRKGMNDLLIKLVGEVCFLAHRRMRPDELRCDVSQMRKCESPHVSFRPHQDGKMTMRLFTQFLSSHPLPLSTDYFSRFLHPCKR